MTNTEQQTGILSVEQANALAITLDIEPGLKSGDPLPPFFHQAFFWTALPPLALGRDGHPKTGLGVIPDMGLPRRMWAGGKLEFHAPLRVGLQATRRTVLELSQRKNGRTGPLGFVTLRHNWEQDGQLCVTEFQDLVYRQDHDPYAPQPIPPQARMDETDCQTRVFSTTTLFRYSALTFNGHRIHYDLDYAKTVEGYDGLVVHGPLLAQILMLMAKNITGSLRSFSFRATAPILHFEQADFCVNKHDMWVRGPDGRQAMQATFS